MKSRHHRHATFVVEDRDRHAVLGQPVVAAVERAASPITTAPMLNCRTRPLQYQHGDSVVTMTVER